MVFNIGWRNNTVLNFCEWTVTHVHMPEHILMFIPNTEAHRIGAIRKGELNPILNTVSYLEFVGSQI